jgi:universal stress protein family protein
MDKVILSLDGSEASHAAVQWCAQHLAPATVVIAVCGIGEFGEFVIGIPPFDMPSSEAGIEECVEHEWTEPLRRAGLHCEPRLVHRRQAPALLQVVTLEQPDALVIGRPPRRPLRDIVGGSAFNKVIHHAGCPIVLVPSDSEAVHRHPLRRPSVRVEAPASPTPPRSVEQTLRWDVPTNLAAKRHPRLAPALVEDATPESIAHRSWS